MTMDKFEMQAKKLSTNLCAGYYLSHTNSNTIILTLMERTKEVVISGNFELGQQEYGNNHIG